jgi:dipeptidyl aminopeptidase/acylaminoacyl peptidase
MIRTLSGAAKFFQFSADFKSAAFVHENITTPPEIYLWTDGDGLRQLTDLNGELAARVHSHSREVRWKGKDGADVRGWLIEPDGGASPRPLLTFVHGGPGMPMSDEFAYYFLGYGGLWPYPFLHFAANGISVFFPNYRGTTSFGDDHQASDSPDGAPLQDIVAGVDYLITEKIADPDRLAIAGQSHGAWLAALVMVRDQRYVVGSFAEGAQNLIVNYSLMPMYLNRVTHDVQYGASLYDNQEFYIDNSADLHFQGLHTAVLFEAGATASAVAMLGSPKAAFRAGMPVEFVVYPQTGHGIRAPQLQMESAERNTDWLRFWLLGEEDPNPEKAEQYTRWRKMRDEQCARLKLDADAPWYCTN